MTPLLLALALGSGQPPPQGPLVYTAEAMKMEPRDRKVFLDGDVQLSRGDLRVSGARAEAEFAPEPKPGPGEKGGKGDKPKDKGKKPDKKAGPSLPGLGAEVQRFTVDGAVHVERAGRTADSDHALFDAAAQTLTLTGPAAAREGLSASPVPVLRDGQERLSGERIVLHTEKDDVEVQRPRLVLHRSQVQEKEKDGPPVPVRIEAKALAIDQDRRVLRFRDEVVLRRADLTVNGPVMDARYDAEGEIELLEVQGGAVLRQGTRRATGKVAVYDARTRVVTLTGSPRLVDRGDELNGERIEMSLDSDEVRVEKARGKLRPDSHKGEETAPAGATPAAGGAGGGKGAP